MVDSKKLFYVSITPLYFKEISMYKNIFIECSVDVFAGSGEEQQGCRGESLFALIINDGQKMFCSYGNVVINNPHYPVNMVGDNDVSVNVVSNCLVTRYIKY